jgi:hypothetical protein
VDAEGFVEEMVEVLCCFCIGVVHCLLRLHGRVVLEDCYPCCSGSRYRVALSIRVVVGNICCQCDRWRRDGINIAQTLFVVDYTPPHSNDIECRILPPYHY